MTDTTCARCGKCCRKGGPLLHLEDMPLAAEGHVPLSALTTLRRGEAVHDPVAGRVLPLEREAVKLTGTGERGSPWRCVFHRDDGTCGIHAHRPAQCRALFCADPRALAALYTARRATRADVLAHAPHAGAHWMDLLTAHEEHLNALADPREARRFDAAFRDLCVERAGLDPRILPFLLGRPLADV